MMQRTLAVMTMLGAVACGGDGAGTTPYDAAPDGPGPIDAAVDAPTGTGNFSFFLTSLDTMRMQSGSQSGFGGNLGGLAGADQICHDAAAAVGFGHKTWRAFLSTYNNGAPIHAIDRIGTGPWYDRNGRLVAMNKAGLIAGNRPAGDAAVINDLPDETGVGTMRLGDTHDVMTGSNAQGQLDGTSAANTCQDWTSAVGGTPSVVRCGHAWPAQSGMHWIRAHTLRGCAPGVNLVQNGPGTGDTVGAGGGWGAIYCFALEP